MRKPFYVLVLAFVLLVGTSACDDLMMDSAGGGNADSQSFRVMRVIDGDTIDIDMNGQSVRVRYIGVNTPERDEACYQEASQANRDLVEGKFVTLERDTTDTDRYDRLLRYLYVDGVMVNEQLVKNGWAEAVLYQPDDKYYQRFIGLERDARNSNIGCHSTGIFADNNDER